MARQLLLGARRILPSSSPNPSPLLSKLVRALSSKPSPTPISHGDLPQPSFHPRTIQFPQIVPPRGETLTSGFAIELVDSDLWGVSFGVAEASDRFTAADDALSDGSPVEEGEASDFDDEIEDLRLQKKLFYKLDKGSIEFEENNFDFHRKKRQLIRKNGREKRTQGVRQNECNKLEKKKPNSKPLSDNNTKSEGKVRTLIENVEAEGKSKRVRVPTFNQLTDPYHLPFCLDIHVTKGSVRACIVHRVTCRVVAVAHSISKDMKFDLGSRKGSKACAAVGAVLAKRAIEDDIHNAVYTPRKGDKIEGKIEIVLRAITENGVDVKVKLKQRRPVKKMPPPPLDAP
ncbi:hypothetical protein ACMD2_00558 [Ananas comosus]|uniref:50S ribosomal protein L18 n=1 Tax=Ananas comosus TaxID=4615 RepID=A0A199UF81_ANACO|nr:hypothetical protein ACMD2_00558 [Ananas comosus]